MTILYDEHKKYISQREIKNINNQSKIYWQLYDKKATKKYSRYKKPFQKTRDTELFKKTVYFI
jgi:hypothetical protein